MNYYGEGKSCCYFHPKEVVVGICALCLKERLLVLASKQGHLHQKDTHKSFKVLRRKPIITLPKAFAIGSLLHLLEFRHQRSDNNGSDEGSIRSLDDSFISIKFEDGRSTWDNKKQPASSEPTDGSTALNQGSANGKGASSTIVEHAKPWGMHRWRKRIGHLLHLARWKRSNKASVCHAGMVISKVDGVQGRRGWIRSLTRGTAATSTEL